MRAIRVAELRRRGGASVRAFGERIAGASNRHSHACWVQAPSGGVQIPQLALQQTIPGSQVVGPHGAPSPEGSSGMHTAWPSRDSQRDPYAHVVTAQGCMPSTHMGIAGHGARTHRTDCRSQY